MLLYAIPKYIAYSLWCWLGFRLLAPTYATLLMTAKYGALRWFIGLGFGLLAALALGSVSPESVTALYLGVYVPLRVIEWGIMAVLIQRSSTTDQTLFRNSHAWLWVLGGIVVSFASDLASPEGMAGRFCVGRCLC
jgi:hypothetical protein